MDESYREKINEAGYSFPPQPCGHPRSATENMGGPGTPYCSICNAEAEAEVRRDDREMVEMDGPLEMREEEVRY